MYAFSGSFTSAEIATYQWFYLISVLLGLSAAALIAVSRWRIFKKLNMPGWKGIIPVYSDYKLFKTRWRVKPFWVLTISAVVYASVSFLINFLMIINLSGETLSTTNELIAFLTPYLVISGLAVFDFLIISLVITLNLNYQLAKSFGDGVGFAIGMTLLPIEYYPILAFADKQKTREKRPLQMVSAVLTIAFVFGIITCAPFSINASAAEVDSADVAAYSENPFGELTDGRYTLTSTTYQLTDD